VSRTNFTRFVIVREFVVAEGRKRISERSSDWKESGFDLLRRAVEYLGTDCRLEAEAERRYRILDYWLSHEVLRFSRQYQLEYEKFSRLIESEGLVERKSCWVRFIVAIRISTKELI